VITVLVVAELAGPFVVPAPTTSTFSEVDRLNSAMLTSFCAPELVKVPVITVGDAVTFAAQPIIRHVPFTVSL